MLFWGVSVIVAMATVLLPTRAWMTSYDQRFTFSCHNNQILTFIESVHSNEKEDRVWNFKCSELPASATLRGCKWSGWVNELDKPVSYHCPDEGVMIGIDSVHDNKREDRQFSFMCCDAGDYIVHKCEMTDYLNDLDGHLEFKVPTGKVLRGMYSYHDNGKEDRRFKFDVCNMDLLVPEDNTIVG